MQNILDKIVDFFHKTIDFFTNPSSIGFAILIAAGLGIILYLMKYVSKQDAFEEKTKADNDSKTSGRNFPLKPF